MPTFQPSCSFTFSAMVSPAVTLSTPMPMTPEWVLKPLERLVAVLALSGQKEVLSWVYWRPATGNWVKVSSSSSMTPLVLSPL